MRKFLYIFFLTLLLPLSVLAQVVNERSESIRVYFHQGSAILDPAYMNNSEALSQLAEMLEPYVMNNAEDKGKIHISSSVSPEGTDAINNRLISDRATAISEWISRQFNAEINYIVGFMGVDWDQLISLVESDENVPCRDEVLDILHNTPEITNLNGQQINERQERLMSLENGAPYLYIYNKLYPQLRYAAAYTEIWYASEMTITTQSPVKFTAAGGKGLVEFKKNAEDKVVPKVNNTAEWIEDIVVDSKSIRFNVAANPTADVRSAIINVESYGKTHEVVIEQEAAEPLFSITYSGDNEFGAEGGEGKITYTTNSLAEVVPMMESGSDWIEPAATTHNEIVYTVAPNTMAVPRKDTITLSCFDQVHQIVVSQQAAEPELTIITPTPRHFGPSGSEDTLAIKTNTLTKVIPNVSTDASWIKGITSTDSHIAYQVARNRSLESRSAVISVESFDKVKDVVINQAPRTECENPFYMSLKTNALYDVALLPNIGVEFYLGHNLSIAGNWHYAWWKSDRIKWYWRTYGGDASLRYWFGKAAKEKPLTGHHIGVYGQMITYDLALGKRGILAEPWSWSVGLEYGYSLPLTKHLNLDLTMGVGYNTGTYYEYLPIDTHYVWQATMKRNHIGPTKMEVSLVWLIGCQNYNKTK